MARFADVEALKRRLDAHRPIPPDIFATIRQKLHIDWTYHSTRIEGGPLTYEETAFFVRTGQTVKGRPLEAYLEYRGHEAALDYLEQLVREQQPLSEALIKELHALLLRGIDWIMMKNEQGQMVRVRIHPGNYKYENNSVTTLDGNIHFYCDHLQVPGEMERLIAWYHEQREHLHLIELAAAVHHQLTAIHPFTDGNGRVARLVMNLILMQAGYVPAVIRDEERQDYLAALEAADAGDPLPLITMIEREVTRTLQLMLDVIEGRTALNEADLERRLETFGRRLQTLDQDYGKQTLQQEETRKSCIEAIATQLKEKLAGLANDQKGRLLQYEIKRWHDAGEGWQIHSNTYPITPVVAHHLAFISSLSYLPNGALHFFIIGIRAVVEVSACIDIDGKHHEEYDLRLEGSIDFTEWDTVQLENFFVRSVDTFLNVMEREAERRRRDALEGTQPDQAPDVGADA